jgi:hypothetical protein
MTYRASQAALRAIQSSGEFALDYISLFRRTGQCLFTMRSGARLQITQISTFICLHLADECLSETICPQNHCLKITGPPHRRACACAIANLPEIPSASSPTDDAALPPAK